MIYISGQKFRGVHLTSWGGANSSWGGAPDKLGGCAPPKKQPKSAPASSQKFKKKFNEKKCTSSFFPK